MTSACWIYAKHAAYTNISFKQITVSYASMCYCVHSIILKACLHTKPTVLFWKIMLSTKGLRFKMAIGSDIVYL